MLPPYDGVTSIAVLNAKALGDFVVTLPALAALRAAYPGAGVTLLGKPWHRAFVAEVATPVDDVAVVPPYTGVRDEPEAKGVLDPPPTVEDPEEIAAFFAAMRARGFDLAVQMQGSGRRANPFVLALGARHTVGMRTGDAAALDRSIPYVHYQSEVLRCLEIAGLAGAVPGPLEPLLAPGPSARAGAGALLAATGVDGPFAVLHPGSDSVRNRWPLDRFAAVARELGERGVRSVVTGRGAERALVEPVVAAAGGAAVDACDALDVAGLAGLLARAALAVSNDTGPLHLARAVGTPTVGVYWAPNVLNWGPVTRGRHRVAQSFDLVCPVCRTTPVEPWPFATADGCRHEVSFVRDVPLEAVLGEALDLLDRHSPSVWS